MSFSVSILATGSELLDGRVLDTNSNFVARELAELGLKLRRVLLVDDDREELVAGLRSLGSVSQLIITSGGLGPTTDDLTREIVSSFFGVGLTEAPEARRHLEEFYSKRGRALDPSNLSQALLPVGSTMIHNELGSAPGFVISKDGGPIVCALSGVPREFKKMFFDTVLPIIKQRAGSLTPLQRVSFKTFGLPESIVGKIVSGCALPPEVVVSYRAAFPEVHVVLKASAAFDLSESAAKVEAALGREQIFTRDQSESFVEALQRALIERHVTVATAESCTGGLIAEMLTRTPGSSEVLVGGVVSYNNSIKERVLHVPAETLRTRGAVSDETVRVMAREVRAMMGTTYGIAVSGIAGPGGGTDEKPVGTFFVGVCGPTGSVERRCLYVSERHNIRAYAAYVALDILRRQLLGVELPEGYPMAR